METKFTPAAAPAMHSAILDLIELCRRNGLDATWEYNSAWATIAAATGEDEIEMRRAALAKARGES